MNQYNFNNQIQGRRTEDDLAAVQDTDEFVARSFVVVDLQQFYWKKSRVDSDHRK